MTKTEEQEQADFDRYHKWVKTLKSARTMITPFEAWQARQPEIDALEAEIARLREALEEILLLDPTGLILEAECKGADKDTILTCTDCISNIATKALEDKADDTRPM